MPRKDDTGPKTTLRPGDELHGRVNIEAAQLTTAGLRHNGRRISQQDVYLAAVVLLLRMEPKEKMLRVRQAFAELERIEAEAAIGRLYNASETSSVDDAPAAKTRRKGG